MYEYLNIDRRAFGSGKEFLRKCGYWLQKCQEQWGLTVSRSFACAHLLLSIESHASQLAGQMRVAYMNGILDFDDIKRMVQSDVTSFADGSIGNKS